VDIEKVEKPPRSTELDDLIVALATVYTIHFRSPRVYGEQTRFLKFARACFEAFGAPEEQASEDAVKQRWKRLRK